MSYDRVLPKPAALHYDSPQVSLSRPTSNLLEHKIMNDNITMVDHQMKDTPTAHRYSDGLPQVNLLSLHRSRLSVNKIPSSPTTSLEVPKPMTALTTKTIPLRERSSSSSPVKSMAPAAKEPVTQFCLCQPDPKIPRPRNAFILYRQHYQAAVVAQNPGLANPDISKIIGEQWRRLPQSTKDEWKALAEEEKARHQQQYPEYRYQPRRYGRDGTSRSLSSGLSHNPPGSTICNRCGGRIMNPPASPDTIFGSGSAVSRTSSQGDTSQARSYTADQAGQKKLGSNGESRASRPRQWDENGSQSPDSKRRRFNPQMPFRADFHRDKSPPGPPYSSLPFTSRSESLGGRGIIQTMQAPRGHQTVKEQPQPDPSLKLPPLQTATPMSASMTPDTPFSEDGFNVETKVKNIPFLNKIKVLSKISPPLPYTFREGDPKRRGPVISVDGQDATLVKTMTEYLSLALQKEGKFHTRIFEGPEIKSQRESSSELEDMGDKTVEYLQRISAWHRVSEKIKSFVKETGSGNEEDDSPGVSPRTIIPKTAEMQISSPPHSSETESEAASTPPETVSHGPLPLAIVPRYQLTTADVYACVMPIADSYKPLDHWQWMASLWRGNVGPDITVYVRETEQSEMERFAGNPVEIRLQDARTVIVRRPANSPKELEEKVLKRVGFEIEDYLTQ